MTHGKTYNKSPRRINHSKTNTGTTALEWSVEQKKKKKKKKKTCTVCFKHKHFSKRNDRNKTKQILAPFPSPVPLK